MSPPKDASREELLVENERLRLELKNKAAIAQRALATFQQRVLQMEEHAAQLANANDEVKAVNAKLSRALEILEQKDKRITEDLEQARTFQQRILPRLPDHPRLAFSAIYRPAEIVGGDIYDVSELAPGHFRLFSADATGHGVQAALRTMILKSEYDRIKVEQDSPARVLFELNRRIYAVFPGLSLQCTAACLDVVLRADGAVARYATAAHPPMLHLTGGALREIYQAGPFLGVVSEIDLPVREIPLSVGDRLFMYTDGVFEQWPGESGIQRGYGALGQPDLKVATARVFEELEAFLGGAELADDATLVGLELEA